MAVRGEESRHYDCRRSMDSEWGDGGPAHVGIAVISGANLVLAFAELALHDPQKPGVLGVPEETWLALLEGLVGGLAL